MLIKLQKYIRTKLGISRRNYVDGRWMSDSETEKYKQDKLNRLIDKFNELVEKEEQIKKSKDDSGS